MLLMSDLRSQQCYFFWESLNCTAVVNTASLTFMYELERCKAICSGIQHLEVQSSEWKYLLTNECTIIFVAKAI